MMGQSMVLLLYNSIEILPPLVESLCRWPSDSSRTSTGRPTHAATKHATHHIEERGRLARPLNAKVLLRNSIQSIIPRSHLRQIGSILLFELPEKVWCCSLDCEQQHTEEVEKWQRWKDVDLA